MHREFVPPGQTVNQHFYLDVSRHLREDVRRKCLEIWQSGDWFLHHDNTPVHTALSVNRYLSSQGWAVVPHPPCSPDLSPYDFFLFLRMKKNLKGKHFDSVEAVKIASQRVLDDIKVEELQKYFEQRERRLDKCINSNGEYFDGETFCK